MNVIPIVQMAIIKDNAGKIGIVFPSEIDELDYSQTSGFFIGIPRKIKNTDMLKSYLKRSKLVMPFFREGETISINAILDFPIVEFKISNFADGEKAIKFVIEITEEQAFKSNRPSTVRRLSRTATKLMRYYRRNFKDDFIKLRYFGGSSLINSNLNFILLRPLDASRYSGLYINNKFLPVGATPEFGNDILKMYSLNENGTDMDIFDL